MTTGHNASGEGEDVEKARRLVGSEGREAFALAEGLTGSALSKATSLRKHVDADVAAAVLGQLELRAKARTKFGDLADELWFTRDGLEQATRPAVSAWRAQRFVDAGIRRVVDLGCGLGTDARAFADAGLDVVAVEFDPTTAVYAQANLAGRAEVVLGRAEDFALADDQATFCDPARRTAGGRTWRVEDFTPSWEFATGLLARDAGGCVKFGPGMPYRLIPEGVGAEWVSHRRDAVEVGLWSFGPAERAATVLGDGVHRIVATARPAVVGELGRFLFEPDPAVIRAAAVDDLAAELKAHRLAGEIAYLTGDEPTPTPFGERYEVVESFRWSEKALRAWTRERDIGVLEIKKRGIEVDPAPLRKRLKLKGSQQATVVLTPTGDGAQVLVVRRV